VSTRNREKLTAERVDWTRLCHYFARNHRLGEHVACEGPTGSGKSTVMLSLLLERGSQQMVNKRPVHITIMGVKPRDRTLSSLGWPRITKLDEWPPGYGEEQVIAWPPYGDPATVAERQEPFFRAVLSEILKSGNQIVYIDETAYFEESKPNGLGLGSLLNQFWYISRANKVSLMAATQRPVKVSRSMWSEPYWLIIFRPEDEDDLKRVAELSGFKQLVLDVVPELGPHEFLFLRRRPERVAVISQVDLKGPR
jgi:hypothetical protein